VIAAAAVAGAPEWLLANGCDRRKHTDCLQPPECGKTGKAESTTPRFRGGEARPENDFLF